MTMPKPVPMTMTMPMAAAVAADSAEKFWNRGEDNGV